MQSPRFNQPTRAREIKCIRQNHQASIRIDPFFFQPSQNTEPADERRTFLSKILTISPPLTERPVIDHVPYMFVIGKNEAAAKTIEIVKTRELPEGL